MTDTEYTYDPVNRLIKEVNGANGITREYTYDEEGNIATVKEGDNVETCVYNAGRLVRVKNGERTTENYSYDTYGNPTYYKSDTRNMWWERGTQLKKYGNETFVYDMQNKLHKRTANGRTHRMYYDGDKLIAMEIGNKILRFFYDLEGIAGFKEGTDNLYTYIKDGQGNVIGLANDYGMKARYVYDAWGECAVTDEYGDEITEWDNAAMLNPIRWKSQYYDNDSGLYYIGNRWYDPKRGRYISAASPEELLQNAGIVFALNLYLLVMSNPVAMMLACGSIEPSLDFYYDGEHKTWWDVWGKWMFLGIGVLATIAACILAPFTCGGSVVGVGVAIGMTLAKIAAATVMGTVISLAIGGVIAGIQSALTGHGFWQGFAENVQGNFVDTLITSFTMAAVTVMLGNIIKFKQCFKEGTLIATEEGLKPIEEIREGDRVLAYDEDTGEQGYKPVVQLFRNETNEWYHVFVNGEEIVCTGGHPFYVVGLDKFLPARELKLHEKVLLSDGSYGTIDSIGIESLLEPEVTYNFEVADYHTYYVGECNVLVHNRCKLGKNMEEAGTKFKTDEDAHHLYPKKFRKDFEKIGIDVDDAVNGIAMESKIHRARAYAYNKLWESVVKNIDKKTAEIYMKQFMKEIYEIVL